VDYFGDDNITKIGAENVEDVLMSLTGLAVANEEELALAA